MTAYRSVFQQLFTWLTETDNTVTGVELITRIHIEGYLAHLRDKVQIGNTRDFAKLRILEKKAFTTLIFPFTL